MLCFQPEVKPRNQPRPSWATSEQIMDVFCQPQQRELRQSFREASRRRQQPLPPPPGPRYPRSTTELDNCLSEANCRLPANIPVIVADEHTPKTEREVTVQQGTIVNSLYKSGKWVFVKTPEDKSGYIPMNCLRPIGAKSRGVCREMSPEVNQTGQGELSKNQTGQNKVSNSWKSRPKDSLKVTLNSSISGSDSSFSADTTLLATDSSFADSAFSETCSFLSARSNTSLNRDSRSSLRTGVYFSPKKSLNDLYRNYCTSSCKMEDKMYSLTVVFDYKALNYDDVSVSSQEVVTSSQEDDSDWVWVKKSNGQEGYIPRACTVNLGLLNLDPHTRTTYL